MKNLEFYLKDSIKNNYCLGAYNFVNMEMAKGICKGCAQSKSPCFLSVSEGAMEYMSPNFVMSLFDAVKKEWPKLPVFLHLDHGKSYEICKKAVDLGFNSVMIDASSLPFEENIKLTKRVVNYAHKHGVLVEAELGVLAGVEDNVASNKMKFTDPDSAKVFVDKTCCDFLAVAIGTSHGAYKFSGKSTLKFDILSKIEEKLPNYPLVLHGASSVPQEYVKLVDSYGGQVGNAKGVDEKLLHKACTEHNIFKINTDTDLRLIFMGVIRKHIAENPANIDIRKFNTLAIDEVAKYIATKNTKIFNCANKI